MGCLIGNLDTNPTAPRHSLSCLKADSRDVVKPNPHFPDFQFWFGVGPLVSWGSLGRF